jgi:hypothetical protein
VRADFFDPLIGHEEIKSLLPTRQVLLGKMLRSELESTIVEPAKKVGLTFDPPKLVQRILDDAGEDEGMLPLLQYALKETWALRKGNTISGDSYTRSGGVREAIRNTAEQTFKELSDEDQRAARQLFLRLVTPGEGQEDTRARAEMPSDPAQRRIVEQFAGARTRLLVTGSDRAQQPTVEVAHEALIRTWPRLREWIDSNREKLRSRAAIVQAKADWEQNRRRDDMLLPAGLQLERARSLLADPGDIGTDDIKEFILLSSAREEAERRARVEALARQEAQVAEKKAAYARTAAAQARIPRFQRWTVAAVGAAAVLAVIVTAGGVQGWLQVQWDKQKRLVDAEAKILAELVKEPDSALRLAVHATRMPQDKDWSGTAAAALAALATAVSEANWLLGFGGHESEVTSAAFSPDGSRIVTASDDQTARIWNAASAKEIAVLRGHGEYHVASAAFSPDGSHIITASWDGTARIWNAASAKEIAVLRGHEGRVNSATFSPDGSRIVTSSEDTTARIWDAASAKEISVLRGHKGGVNSATFSPDGSRIVTSSEDTTARIWDAASAKEIAVLRGFLQGGVNSATFSPDGSRIVTAADYAAIWNAANAKEIAPLFNGGRVKSASFSPDGSRIVTASRWGTAHIWDAASAKEIVVLRGHEGGVNSATFSPDGSRIVTSSSDKTARIWDPRTERMSMKDLLAQACLRLAGLTKLTRHEMRLAGYPDSMPEIDVCTSGQ